MATRANVKLQYALIQDYAIESSQTATVGKFLKFGTTDETIQDASAGDLPMGFCLSKDPISSKVQAVLGNAVVAALVGTGGATRGKYAIIASDGVTDKTLGGGTTVQYVVGQFLQTGVVGDLVGLRIIDAPSVSA